MTLKLKNKTDFNHAATYLTNQTYCFDRYDTQLMIRFSQVSQAQDAINELAALDIKVEATVDLLPAFAA